MIRTTLLRVPMAVLLAVAAAPLAAQLGGQSELTGEVIRNQRRDLVAQVLPLDASEAEAFWPLYAEYRQEMDRVDGQRVEVLDEYVLKYGILSSNEADELIDGTLGAMKAEWDIKSKYVRKLRRILPERKVARFLQIEAKLDAVVAYELAEAIPRTP